MKIAIVADTHWGVSNDSVFFHDYFKKSVDQFLIPELKSRGIEQIIHLGDLVHRRKYINFQTAQRLHDDFLEPINREFKMDIIAGNHDTFFKNTNDLNSLEILIKPGVYNNIRLFTDPTEVMFDDKKLLYVPWICQDNYENTIKQIDETRSQIVFGHLELQGFEMYKGYLSTHGYDKKIFDKFDAVFSGHYHHRSISNNICYVGALCEHNWSDYNDPRGFSVYDTASMEFDFIQNPFTIFKKVHYDDAEKTIENVMQLATDVQDKIIKIIVKNKNNAYWFDLFIEKLEGMSPADMQTVEDHLNLNVENSDDIVNEASDTLTIFKSYINQLDLEGQKKSRVEKVVMGLYTEAINLI